MRESNLTNNDMAVEGHNVKRPFLKIIIILIFLIVLGIFLYFFKDTILSIFNKKIYPKDISTEVSEPEKDSPFGNLVSDLDVESDVKGPEYYIDLYDEYKMGGMGRRYIFKSFDEAKMSLTLIEKNDDDEIERNFYLAEDFLIVCTTFDISRYGLDFSRLDDVDKYVTALKSSSMTLEEKKTRISSYQEGATFDLVFTDMNFDSNSKVKKILMTSSDLDSCYFYE